MIKLPIIYSQRDTCWKNKKLGTSNSSLGDYGCLVTAMAILACYYGKDTDPDRFNQSLVAVGGFANSNLYKWYEGITKVYPDIVCTKLKETPFPLTQIHWNEVDKQLDSGKPVIIQVDFQPNTQIVDMHFVLIIDGKAGDYMVADPYYGDIAKLTRYGEPKITIQSYVFHDGPIQPEVNPQVSMDADFKKGWDVLEDYRKKRKEGPEGNFEGFIRVLIDRDEKYRQREVDLGNANKKIEQLSAVNQEVLGQNEGLRTAVKDWEKFQDELWHLLNPINGDKNTANIKREIKELLEKEDNCRKEVANTQNWQVKYKELLDKVRAMAKTSSTDEEAVLATLQNLVVATTPSENSPVEPEQPETPKKPKINVIKAVVKIVSSLWGVIFKK